MKNLLSLLLLFSIASCTHPTEEADVVKAQSKLSTVDTTSQQLEKLGIELPAVATPAGNYVNAVPTSSGLMYLAGKGPLQADGTYITGKVGRDLTIEEGYAAARLTGLHHIAVLKDELGSLDRVKRIVQVTGMVNAIENFGNQPEVMNGYSDLMAEVFGARGKHARCAVGMGSLPRNIAVEVAVVVEIEQ